MTQEIKNLVIFLPISCRVMIQPLRLDHLWAGLSLVGAVYFVLRSGGFDLLLLNGLMASRRAMRRW